MNGSGLFGPMQLFLFVLNGKSVSIPNMSFLALDNVWTFGCGFYKSAVKIFLQRLW